MDIGLRDLAADAVAVGEAESSALAGIASFYLSDRGYVSKPSDSPPSTIWLPRVQAPLAIERSLPLTPDAPRRLAVQFGDILLNNADGYFDDLVTRFALDGRRVAVKVGAPSFGYADFKLLYDGTAQGWWLADDNSARIRLRDAAWSLEIPLQQNLYAGTGGLAGGADLAGKPKPLAYGACGNVTAALVDPSALIYQVHDGAVQAIDAVYERGAAMTPAGDVADITAASVPAGNFKTQLSGGYFRLGSTPQGQITADLRGDAAGGSYVESTGAIALRVLLTRSGLSASALDGYLFDALAAQQPAPVDIFVGTEERPTVAEFLDRLLRGIGGWWGTGREGRIGCGRLVPATGDPQYAFGPNQILRLERLDLPETISPPNWRRRVAWGRNWTVQTSDIAGGVTAARRAFLAEAYRVATAADAAVKAKHLLATDPDPVEGLFVNQADAEGEANRLLGIYSPDRQLLRATLKLPAFLVELGAKVKLSWPRYGLANGKLGVAVGQGFNGARNEVQLTVLI